MSDVSAGPSQANSAALRVLIVEDSRFDAELLIEALHDALPGAQAQVVSSESAFAKALAEGGLAAILSDYEVPGFSGERALELAIATAPTTPFIFVSGVIGEDNAVELLKQGAVDYVSKSRLSRLKLVLTRALKESAQRLARADAEQQLASVNDQLQRQKSRNDALIELGDRIREIDDPVEIGYAAAEVLARVLNVDRAGYGIVNKIAEHIEISKDWNAPGVRSIAGTLKFVDYGTYFTELRRGITVVVADAYEDSRTRSTADALAAITARSFVNLPLTEKGDFVGLLYLNHGSARQWQPEEISFVRDVADRVRATIARREAQQGLQALARSLAIQVQQRTQERDRTWELSQDLLCVVNARGEFESVNPSWEKTLGWSPNDIRGRPFRDLVHPDDHAATDVEFANLLRGERTIGFENRYRAKDGSYCWLSWTVVPSEGLLYGAARDVTAAREHAAELDAAREQLRQSQKLEAVGQLTGGIAHDFNNLLAAIDGSLALMSRQVTRANLSDIDRYIGVARGAAKRAAVLTHRLLAFSRRQTLDPRPLSMNRLVNDMEELVRRTIGPSITLETVTAMSLWNVKADAGQLESALLNLCINARDAMPEGGRLTIETSNRWIDARTAARQELQPGQYVSMCVSDTGVGMSRDVIAQAFDPFFTTKPLGQGTGLGLSMIYGFTKQSGGQVRIYSEVGQGTMVCIYLPRHSGREVEEAAPQAAVEPTRAVHGKTILVVDDEPALRMLIAEVLENLGYATLEAGDGAEALVHLRAPNTIDLLVTDVGLPGGMNGRQLAEAARAERPGLKTLYITGYAENAVLSHGHLEPGMQILTKPFEFEMLSERVKTLIDGN